jgi:hypothetical protein
MQVVRQVVERQAMAQTLDECMARLSPMAKQAFQVALLLGADVEPIKWAYVGDHDGGSYTFKHKLTGQTVTV